MRTSVAPILPGLAFLVLLALVATVVAGTASFLSPLVVGVVLGALVANVLPVPAALAPGITFGARSLLRLGIVLLGSGCPSATSPASVPAA